MNTLKLTHLPSYLISHLLTSVELCAEFNETLELSNWVENETWYMDQYLQHFQVSPALTSPNSSLHNDATDLNEEDADGEANTVLTFKMDKDNNDQCTSPITITDLPAASLSACVIKNSIQNITPVSVKIYEPSNDVSWHTLSSPCSGMLTSPRLHDSLLCSPGGRLDGLLNSPIVVRDELLSDNNMLHSPGVGDCGLLGSPCNEQYSTLDPNLIQPHYNNSTIMNLGSQGNLDIVKDDHPTVLRGTKFQSAFYRTNKTFDTKTTSAFTKSIS